jgi:hypothetical protein
MERDNQVRRYLSYAFLHRIFVARKKIEIRYLFDDVLLSFYFAASNR